MSDSAAPQSPRQETVHRLLQVISGELPIADANALLHPALAARMDGKLAGHNPAAWRKWVRFLRNHAAQRMSGLRIAVDSMSEDDDIVTVHAKWRGIVNGKETASESGVVAYRVQDGKITDIWTHKKNYVFIYGERITNPLFFYWLLLRIALSDDSDNN